MKKVLVTGGAGFIGANLVRRLLERKDCKVIVFEKEGTDTWRLEDVMDDIDFRYVNLEVAPEVQKAIEETTPNITFHLASYGVYGGIQKDEIAMELVNIRGTIHLIESLENDEFERLIFASTSFVYAGKGNAIGEQDKIEPMNTYAKTKFQAEQDIAAIAKDKDMSVIIARLFTPYGYYEDKQRLIPHLILNALEGNPIDLASPDNVRDFVFIEDMLNLFMSMMDQEGDYKGEIFNVGSGEQHSVREVAETVEKVVGRKLPLNFGKVESPYQEPKNFIADISKAKKEFSWEPNNNVEQGIEKAVQWFKEHKNLYV